MGHLPDFISDLAIILIFAGIVTIIFKWLKQPVVLGYIVAGVLASPYITWLPSVADMESITVWSEIGVIFLLFALGLEFSFKKLMDVGGTASIGTLINMGSMIIIGYVVGLLLGWSHMDSIFLGGMLSMSSTTIIIKAFNDMNLQKKKFASIVFGMLIVEDLAAILMMVLLSTVAVSQQFQGTQLVTELFKLIFFMIIWFVTGIFLIPTFLKKMKKYLNDETLLIVAIGLCLGMVLFASYVGFSAALGAFIMGSILAETIEAKHIEHLLEPLKNLFGAVFFVSVGMMVNPSIVVDYAPIIILFTVVILVGRPIFAALGVMASGQGLRVSVHAGFSLAQIGEFSFIIAALGMSLGVISETLYPIIIAVSVITTFTTPYFIKIADPVSDWLEKVIPEKWNKIVVGYSATSYNTVTKHNDWHKLLKSIASTIVIYTVICIGVIQLFVLFINPIIIENIPELWGKILSLILALICMAPLLRTIIMKKNGSTEFRTLWAAKQFNRVALTIIIAFRILVCLVLVMVLLKDVFPEHFFISLGIASAYTGIIIFFKGIKAQSRRLESIFIENLNSKQIYEDGKAAITSDVTNDLLSKDIHIEEVEVTSCSPSVGKNLAELNFRQNTGVNIISIIRGNRKINIPDGRTYLYPHDKIVVAGSDNEIQQFIQRIEERNVNMSTDEDVQHHISLSQYIIGNESSMIEKSIKELNIREKTECMIIGIDRKNISITKFDADFIFEENDVLWLAGEKDKLASFEENISK